MWSFWSGASSLYLLHLSLEYVGFIPESLLTNMFFWQGFFFFFRALSCQVHMSLHMILKRHCYGHLDLSANPDDCDWIKRLKKKQRLSAFFFSTVIMLRPGKALRFYSIRCPFPLCPTFLSSVHPLPLIPMFLSTTWTQVLATWVLLWS